MSVPPFRLPLEVQNPKVISHSVPFKKAETEWVSPEGKTYEIKWIKDAPLNFFARILRAIGVPFGLIAQVFSQSKKASQWFLEAKLGNRVHLAYVEEPSLFDRLHSQVFEQFVDVLHTELNDTATSLKKFLVMLLSYSKYQSLQQKQENVYKLGLQESIIKNIREIPEDLIMIFDKNGSKITFDGTQLISYQRSFIDPETNEDVGSGKIKSIALDNDGKIVVEVSLDQGAIRFTDTYDNQLKRFV